MILTSISNYTFQFAIILKDLLGTPETKRSGLRTLNARNALTSKPSIFKCDNAELNNLQSMRNKFLYLKFISKVRRFCGD
jgi:hypothetical protein